MRSFYYLIVVLIICSGCDTKPKQDNPPNILFILIDDMGWKDVGYAGSTFYDTPHIDKLASEGIYFTNAYSPAPVCTPSRGGIFSGKFPGRIKLTTVFNGPAGPDDRLHAQSKYRGENDQYFEARHRHALPKSEVIIAQALAEGGYRTGFFGKWHIGECSGYYPDQSALVEIVAVWGNWRDHAA
jgi:arylsulfatase A-like enzyme